MGKKSIVFAGRAIEHWNKNKRKALRQNQNLEKHKTLEKYKARLTHGTAEAMTMGKWNRGGHRVPGKDQVLK